MRSQSKLLYFSLSALHQVVTYAQQQSYPDIEERIAHAAMSAKTEATHLLQLRVNGVAADNSLIDLVEDVISSETHQNFSNEAEALKKTLFAGSKPQAKSVLGAATSFVQLDSHGFDPADYDWRRELFRRRVAKIEQHNKRDDKLWTAVVNHFAHRTDAELSQLLGWRGPASADVASAPSSGGGPLSFIQIGNLQSVHAWGETGSLPRDVSWSHLNASKNIQNQGECGSCWAVTSATILEAHREIHMPWSPKTFSVDELVACVPNPHHCGGQGHCNGATVELAMDYAAHYGLSEQSQSESSPASCPRERLQGDEKSSEVLLESGANLGNGVPRESLPGLRNSPAAVALIGRGIGMRAWERLPPNTYAPLMHALVERGPAAVAVSASDWFDYGRGVFDGCSKDAIIDHAVTLIGYGYDTDLKKKFWHIQNSWGPEWGEDGTIRLLRRDNDDTEQCGMDTQPEVGNGCDGGPKQVRVCGMCGLLYDAVVPHF